MSYRYRIAKVDKEFYEKVKDMKYDELVEFSKEHNPDAFDDCDEENVYLYGFEVLKQEEIFDLGDCDFEKEVEKTSIPAFTKTCVQEALEHYNIRLCNKETFLVIIDEMRKLVVKNMQRLRDNPELVYLHFEDKLKEWKLFEEVIDCSSVSDKRKAELNKHHYPYDIDIDSEQLVRSLRYEYAIFELVRLYKSFDWEKYNLVFYGW